MKRFLTAVLIWVVCIVSAGDRVLIWEASAPKLPGKAYIAGSIHSGKANWYPLDLAYDRALDAASAVYFEIYPLNQQEVAQKTLFYGLFQGGRTLRQVLNGQDYQAVCAFYAKYSPGMNPQVLDRFRPWLLSVQIAQLYLMQHPEISRACGLENVFSKHLGGKPGRGLENADDQFLAMSAVPDAAAGAVLMENVRDFNLAGRDLDRIFRALETGEPDELSLIANEMAFKHPEFHRELFLNRNRKIAEKIYELLKTKQTVFILVGAGHVAGKGNILEFLREKGCSTIQLKRAGRPGRIQP